MELTKTNSTKYIRLLGLRYNVKTREEVGTKGPGKRTSKDMTLRKNRRETIYDLETRVRKR